MLCCVNYIECWDIQYLFVSGIDMVEQTFLWGILSIKAIYFFSKLKTRFCNNSKCWRECYWEEKVSQMQTTLSATVARTNCMLCMDFRKAPDKPIATTRIKYFISADFFFFTLTLLYLKGKGSDTRDLIAFKGSLTKQYLFRKVTANCRTCCGAKLLFAMLYPVCV